MRRDPVGGGATSWRLLDGGMLGPKGVTIHGEEEKVV
jgi:hypothetical protein